jgi:hypothetical protein
VRGARSCRICGGLSHIGMLEGPNTECSSLRSPTIDLIERAVVQPMQCGFRAARGSALLSKRKKECEYDPRHVWASGSATSDYSKGMRPPPMRQMARRNGAGLSP